MISIIRGIEKHFQEIVISSLVFYLFKTAFWPLTYFCIVSYVLVCIVFFYRISWNLHIKEFIIEYILPIILALVILLCSIYKGYYRNEIIQKDLIRIAILFSYFYFLFWNSKYFRQGLPILFGTRLVVFTTGVIAIINIIKNLVLGFIPTHIIHRLNISDEMALSHDYNFFSLFLILGLVTFNYRNNASVKLGLSKIAIRSFNIIVGMNVIISGSRRGIIALMILIVVYYINEWLLQRRSLIKENKAASFLLVVIIIVFIAGIILYKTTSQDKISNSVLRYGSFFGINDRVKIDRFLWKKQLQKSTKGNFIITKEFFKRNPGYWIPMEATGTSLSSVITPYGKGIRILRENSPNTGGVSLLYNGPAILYYANHTYKISFKIKFLKGDINSFSVGWYAANGDGGKDFTHLLSLVKDVENTGDGWYSCTSYYTFIDNQIGLSGFINSVLDNSEFIIADFELIDLDYSAGLPKFLIELNDDLDPLQWMNSLNRPLSSDSNLLTNSDFSSGLNYWGHNADSVKIITVRIDNQNAALVERGNGNGEDWSLFYKGRHILFKKENLYQLSFKFKPVVPDRIPFVVGFGIDEPQDTVDVKNLKLSVQAIENGWFQVSAKYKFKESYADIIFPIRYQLNNSKFYITDIKLVNLDESSNTSSFVADGLNRLRTYDNKTLDYFFSDRKDRYLYSIELWKKNYKWYNKLFGHGFDYLTWYGEKYIKTQASNDWPHNPFITVLLYSGIIGLLLYFWLLFNVISYYIKLRKTYAMAFLCFILTFYFSFFSGSSPFDPPVMGFFILLPFFIHSIDNKDNSSDKKK
jgi:hypothetical protein